MGGGQSGDRDESTICIHGRHIVKSNQEQVAANSKKENRRKYLQTVTM